jgi:signal transduction histidine kinase
MRHLATELSMAQLRERQRIAAELHDGICQMLSSSNIRLAVLKESELSEQTAESIDKVCRILEDSLKQTRSLIFELSCPMLKELGLEAALDDLCSSMSNDHSVLIEFSGNDLPLPLTFEEQTHLYRLVRELLTNVARHSKANAARVTLTTHPDRLEISVKDDGVGFDASSAGRGFSPTGGFGLFNLCEYLQHIGGSLTIDSAPGFGTKATITFPLKAPND